MWFRISPGQDTQESEIVLASTINKDLNLQGWMLLSPHKARVITKHAHDTFPAFAYQLNATVVFRSLYPRLPVVGTDVVPAGKLETTTAVSSLLSISTGHKGGYHAHERSRPARQPVVQSKTKKKGPMSSLFFRGKGRDESDIAAPYPPMLLLGGDSSSHSVIK